MDISLSFLSVVIGVGFRGVESGGTGDKEHSPNPSSLRPQFPVLCCPRYGIEGK